MTAPPAEQDETFHRWISAHRPILRKIARAYAATPVGVRELENEMLFQVWRSVMSFSGAAKEFTWIYRVCLNTAMTWRRVMCRRDNRVEPESDTQAMLANERSPAEAASDRGLLDRLYEAIRLLPDFDRGLVLLSLEGLTYRQMADISGLSENRLGVVLTRAPARRWGMCRPPSSRSAATGGVPPAPQRALEGFGGVAMAGVLAAMAWRIGSTAWPIMIGAVLIFAVACVFVADFFRGRRMRLGLDATMLARLEAEIEELQHQRQLLAHIGWWYFLPYPSAIALIGVTLAHTSEKHAPSGFLRILLTTPATLAWILTLVAVSGGAIFWAWRSTRRATTSRIDPRIIELENCAAS